MRILINENESFGGYIATLVNDYDLTTVETPSFLGGGCISYSSTDKQYIINLVKKDAEKIFKVKDLPILDKTIEVKGEKELVILFEALDEDDFRYTDIEGLNFIYLSAQIFIDGELSSECLLTARGDIENGTQTNEFEGEYTIDTSGFRVTYHNNQDGEDYTQGEFIREFCGNSKYQMIGEFATRNNIYVESVSAL